MKSNATAKSIRLAKRVLRRHRHIHCQKELHHLSTDLCGHKNKELLVLGYKGKEYWWAQCECLKIFAIKTTRIRDGQSTCGCKANAETHGGSNSLAYTHFRRLLKRNNPRITRRWLGDLGFQNFLEDLGDMPKKGCILVTKPTAKLCNKNTVRWVINNSKQYLKHKLTFNCYRAMVDRAENSYLSHIKGKRLADRWKYGEGLLNGFAAFIEDMGTRPSRKHTIDRLNNNKGYLPSNCRWADKHEQRLNQRTRVNWLKFKGQRRTLHKWSRETGLSWGLLKKRYAAGMSAHQVLAPI